jgi:hypothetical protein
LSKARQAGELSRRHGRPSTRHEQPDSHDDSPQEDKRCREERQRHDSGETSYERRPAKPGGNQRPPTDHERDQRKAQQDRGGAEDDAETQLGREVGDRWIDDDAAAAEGMRDRIAEDDRPAAAKEVAAPIPIAQKIRANRSPSGAALSRSRRYASKEEQPEDREQEDVHRGEHGDVMTLRDVLDGARGLVRAAGRIREGQADNRQDAEGNASDAQRQNAISSEASWDQTLPAPRRILGHGSDERR